MGKNGESPSREILQSGGKFCFLEGNLCNYERYLVILGHKFCIRIIQKHLTVEGSFYDIPGKCAFFSRPGLSKRSPGATVLKKNYLRFHNGSGKN